MNYLYLPNLFQVVNAIFTENLKELKLIARRITQRGKACDPLELINETFISLHNKPAPKQPNEFIKWFSRSMKLTYIAERGQIQKNKLQAGNEPPELSFLPSAPIYKNQNDTNGTPSHLNATQALLFIRLIKFKKELPLWEQIVFELHFEKKLSAKKIVSEVKGDVNKRTIDAIIKSINDKLKLKKWKRLNS